MGASFIPIVVFTVLWGIVGIVCPFFAPKGPNRGIIQVVLMLTAATCWLFWLCAYMAQMNPLIGPRLDNETLIWMSRTWLEVTVPLWLRILGQARFHLQPDHHLPSAEMQAKSFTVVDNKNSLFNLATKWARKIAESTSHPLD